MKNGLKFELAVERSKTLVVRRRSPLCTYWCRGCGREVRMVTADEAAAITGTGPRVIFRSIEAGHLHVLESAGDLLICWASLTTIEL